MVKTLQVLAMGQIILGLKLPQNLFKIVTFIRYLRQCIFGFGGKRMEEYKKKIIELVEKIDRLDMLIYLYTFIKGKVKAE